MSKTFAASLEKLRAEICAAAADKSECADVVLAHFCDNSAASLQQSWDGKVRGAKPRVSRVEREFIGCVLFQAAAVSVSLEKTHIVSLVKSRADMGVLDLGDLGAYSYAALTSVL